MTRRNEMSQRAPGTVTPPAIRDGILIVHGYGLHLAVDRGHLTVSGGIAGDRWSARFSRIDRSLKRVVILGDTGTLTLDAISWLHRVGIPLVHLRPDGTLLFVSAPSAAAHPPIRRAQALAAETGTGLRLSVALIRTKIERQVALLASLPANTASRTEMTSRLAQLDQVRTAQDLRVIEAHAAKAYWTAWRDVPVQVKKVELARCPTHWTRFTGRTSPLSRSTSPRRAVNPANAVLNYLYAILEAEARLAALAVGLDPMLGLLHSDHGARDSLALDLMEPVRPLVDAYLRDLLARHTFTRAEVFETVEGQCRLMPALTRELTLTAPTWSRAVLLVAQQVARQLLHDAQAHHDISAKAPARRVRPQLRQARDFAPRLDKADDPRYRGDAVASRRRAMVQVHRANQRWERAGTRGIDREQYVRDVVPQLATVKLSHLMCATGLTNASCSLIRRGLTIPHPRHWAPLAGTIAPGDKYAT